jgi:hypothetical protein
MPRPSTVAVTQINTFAFILQATQEAGGTAGEDIDPLVTEFLNTGDAVLMLALSTVAFGAFAASDPVVFENFLIAFEDKLAQILAGSDVNWLGEEEFVESLVSWTIDTTLGEMSANMVDEFDPKVELIEA